MVAEEENRQRTGAGVGANDWADIRHQNARNAGDFRLDDVRQRVRLILAIAMADENHLPFRVDDMLLDAVGKDADTAALNELLIAKKRLGGWFSKGIIVTFSREKQEGTGTYQRCKMLGLEMLDERDILAVDFRERLVRTIREHDLISLKWKKV